MLEQKKKKEIMLKNILKATGAQELSKVEQQTINGGSGSVTGPERLFCSNTAPSDALWRCFLSAQNCTNGKLRWTCRRKTQVA
jgi:hypothetical protein